MTYGERHRPRVHFSPATNWMNDPNGLVYHDGDYHLFYQYNPLGNAWGHMSWGHAVSPDLVHWEHLPVAIPAHDASMIFSGSALVDTDNCSGLGTVEGAWPAAIYTAHTTDSATSHVIQTQNLATSTDSGRSWHRFPGNPVLDIGSASFRDPQVFWHEPTGRWIMIVALSDERKVRFLASRNLIDWHPLSDFGPLDVAGGIWECPLLIELPVNGSIDTQRWLLKVDINPGHPAGGSGAFYLVGDFDGVRFAPDPTFSSPQWVDFGADFYAAQHWSYAPSSDGERVWIGWMSNWAYASATPTSPWRGTLTLPRTIDLVMTGDGPRLRQRPLAALECLRESEAHIAGGDLAQINRVLAEARLGSEALELIVQVQTGPACDVGLRISTGQAGAVRIGYDSAREELYLDRSMVMASPFAAGFAARHAAPLRLDEATLRLHVFIDASSVEVFAGDGTVVMTDLIFPDSNERAIDIDAIGGEVAQVDLSVWTLRSIGSPHR